MQFRISNHLRPLIWSRSQSAWAQYVIWPSVPARSHGIHLLRHAGHRSTGKLKQLSGNRVTASTHPMADSPCCKASTLFPCCLSLFCSSQSHERTAAPAAAKVQPSYTLMIYITYKHTQSRRSRRLSLRQCQVPHTSHANYHGNAQPESSLLAVTCWPDIWTSSGIGITSTGCSSNTHSHPDFHRQTDR